MKKQLHHEIQHLAKELIAIDENFNTVELQKKVIRLYESLSVLHYFEKQVGGATSDTSSKALDSKSYREKNWFKEPEPIPASGHEEDLVEPLMEKIKDLVAQMPPESAQIDELLDEVLPKKKYMKNDLEEFASNYQQMPTFQRKENTEKRSEKKNPTFDEKHPSKGVNAPKKSSRLVDDLGMSTTPATANSMGDRPRSINDAVNNGMTVGLNDRIAFIKHLFNNNTQDYTRVLSQINTCESLKEATSFIQTKVRPDYNNWSDKEEYADRFMSIVEKRFN